jgi:hypothetical protein
LSVWREEEELTQELRELERQVARCRANAQANDAELNEA